MEPATTSRRAHTFWQGIGWVAIGLLGASALAVTVLLVVEMAVVAKSALIAQHQASIQGLPRSVLVAGRNYLISPTQMDSADAVVKQSIVDRLVPGAALAIGERGRILQLAGYGRVGWTDRDSVVSADSTRYDLASLTKAVATTSAVYLLLQDGKIHLDDPIQRWVPEFQGPWKDRVTWRQLLTHTSGLPAGGRMRGRTAAQRLHSLLQIRLDAQPGVYVQYSDLSYIVLWTAAQRVAGEPLPQFLQRRLWGPLRMSSTDFWPGEQCDNCAPTLVLRSGEPYRGKPSDPIAHKLGIPTGNAGLFSTAHDLARFAAMIANGGVLDGVRIFKPELVRALFQQVPGAGHRTLGWEAFCPAENPTQQQACVHPIAYGHTGWTGTSLWIHSVGGAWVVILSNRSYDVKRPPSLGELRENVFLHVASGAASPGVADLAADSVDSVANRPLPDAQYKLRR